MMTSLQTLLLTSAALTAVIHGRAIAQQSTPVQPPADVQWIELTVAPAAEPEPALRYELLPGYLDEHSGNAAVLYLRALLLGPGTDAAMQLPEWLGVPMEELRDANHRAEIGMELNAPTLGDPSMFALFRYAGASEFCDWQISLREDEVLQLIPELARLREMAMAVAVRARIQIADGDLDGALESIQAGLALAHQLESGSTLIQGLVGSAIGAMFIDRVVELIDHPDSPNLYWALTQLPSPLVDFRASLRAERHLLEAMVPEIESIRSGDVPDEQWPTLAQSLIERMATLMSFNSFVEEPTALRLHAASMSIALYPAARDRMIRRREPPEAVDAMPVTKVVLTDALHQYSAQRDDLYKWAALPFAHGFPEMEKAMRARRATGNADEPQWHQPGWPFTELLAAIDKAWAAMVRLDRRIAAARTIEALRLHAAMHGNFPGALNEITAVPVPDDPMTGEPFGYQRDGNIAKLWTMNSANEQPMYGLHYAITLAAETKEGTH